MSCSSLDICTLDIKGDIYNVEGAKYIIIQGDSVIGVYNALDPGFYKLRKICQKKQEKIKSKD